jgi:DNA-binding protein H-NS
MQVGTDYESDSIIAKRLQERQYKFKLLEEKLSLQKTEIQTRLQEIDTELKSVEEMIKGEIGELFSYSSR